MIGFYNPRGKKHDWKLACAIEIVRDNRNSNTSVTVTQNITHSDESRTITTLGKFNPADVDIFTLVPVGNDQTSRLGSWGATRQSDLQEDSLQEDLSQSAESTPKSLGNQYHDFCLEEQSQPISQPRIYPIALTGLRGERVLIVSGGLVGERKVKNLLIVGAHITLVSPRATPHLQKWAASGQIQWQSRSYQTDDCISVRLVYAATNQRMVNAQIAQDAAQLGLLCNVADACTTEGNFHLPAVHRQDDVVIAVSTEQAQPKHATKIT